MSTLISRAEAQGKIEHLATLALRADLRALRRDADEARGRLVEKQKQRDAEALAWNDAFASGTAEAWANYLRRHGSSDRAAQARGYEERALDQEVDRVSSAVAALKRAISISTDASARWQSVLELSTIEKRVQAAAAMRPQSDAEAARIERWRNLVTEIAEAKRFGQATMEAPQIIAPPEVSLHPTDETVMTGSRLPVAAPAAFPTVAELQPMREPEPESEPIGEHRFDEPIEAHHFGQPALEPLLEPLVEPWNVPAIHPDIRAEEPVVPVAAPAVPVRRKKRVYYLVPLTVVIIAAIILLGAWFVMRRLRIDAERARAREVAAAPHNVPLIVDARPWSQVSSVKDGSGKEWLRSAQYTPLMLSLPPGEYKVTFHDPTSNAAREETAQVTPGGPAFCSTDFAAQNPLRYFEDAGWK